MLGETEITVETTKSDVELAHKILARSDEAYLVSDTGKRAALILQEFDCLFGHIAALREMLVEVAPIVCGDLCPSVKRTGTEWTHVDLCKRIHDILGLSEEQGVV